MNTEYAARMLHYYLEIGAKGKYGTPEFEVLNKNAQFWNDFNYTALQSVFIALGKIFDTQHRAHSLTKMMDELPSALGHFNKEAVSARKIAASPGGDPEITNEFMKSAHEMSLDDVAVIQEQVDKANDLWEKMKGLRHQVYAHSQMLTDEQRRKLYDKVTFGELEHLIEILLGIGYVLWQAEWNGSKPDFNDTHPRTSEYAEKEIESLFVTLTKGAGNA